MNSRACSARFRCIVCSPRTVCVWGVWGFVGGWGAESVGCWVGVWGVCRVWGVGWVGEGHVGMAAAVEHAWELSAVEQAGSSPG